jgi:hypothetical protein
MKIHSFLFLGTSALLLVGCNENGPAIQDDPAKPVAESKALTPPGTEASGGGGMAKIETGP